MGFRLPQNKYHKIGYNIAQSFIIFILPIIFSDHIMFIPDLSVLAFFRNYQMFGIRKSIYYLVFLVIFSIATYEYINSPYKMVQKSNYTMINSIYFILASAIALCFVIIAKESQKKLAIALKQVQEYSIKIEEQAIQIERNRIKRDIHDSFGNSLITLKFRLEKLIELDNSGDYKDFSDLLKDSQEICLKSLKNIRYVLNNLDENSLNDLSFEDMIRKIIVEFENTIEINTKYFISINRLELSQKTKNTIYRILQEIFTNIIRHSQAKNVNIQIFTLDNHINILVQDDGKGFDPNQYSPGYGLKGMQERINILKGYFNLISELDKGTIITFNIPI
jgi:signal transduction histidine kinase